MTTVHIAVKSVDKARRAEMKARNKKESDAVLKKLPSGFADDAARMSVEELRDCIVESENNLRNVRNEMQQNEKLQGALSLIKDLKTPYNDARKAQQAKIQYCLRLLEEQGHLTDEAHDLEEA